MIEEDILKTIDRHNNILISAHVRLDGDSIGSEIALYHAIKGLGKEPTVVNDSPIPRVFTFLPETSLFHTREGDLTEALNGKYDLLISLDTPSLSRLGKVSDIIPPGLPVINIDHHVSNSSFGDLNLIHPEASSTGEIVLHLLRETAQEITPPIATALYVAIITDTGRFTHSNTTSESLRSAAYLIDHGADPTEIANQLYKTNTSGNLLLQASATQTMRLENEGRIASIKLTREMMEKTKTSAIDTQEFPEIPVSIDGVKVGLLFREMNEADMIKVSLRSQDGVDVNKIAQKFGGGGHKYAAGCEIKGSITDAENLILEEARGSICNLSRNG